VGLFSGLFKQKTAETPVDNPAAWLSNILGGNWGDAWGGKKVTTQSSLSNSVVWGCINILSSDLCKLPIELWWRKEDGKKVLATTHPVVKLLRKPNRWQTLLEVVRQQMVSLLLAGNSYNVILRDSAGRPVDLVPIEPGRVTIQQDEDGDLWYFIQSGDWLQRAQLGSYGVKNLPIPQRDMLHIRGITLNGVVGLSPISAARNSTSYSNTMEQYGAQLFAKGARPSGVLTYPGKLNKESRERVREQWEELFSASGAGRTAVLDNGTQWQNLSLNSTDAQFLESRRFEVEEIARFFRVPLHLLNNLDKATFNNIEQQTRSYYDNTLLYYIRLFETAYENAFDLESTYELRFDVMQLLRADAEGRSKMLAAMRQWGVASADELRDRENFSPLNTEYSQATLLPVNMIPVSKTGSLLANTLEQPVLQSSQIDDANKSFIKSL
jgi:HK97 family phage portal protein